MFPRLACELHITHPDAGRTSTYLPGSRINKLIFTDRRVNSLGQEIYNVCSQNLMQQQKDTQNFEILSRIEDQDLWTYRYIKRAKKKKKKNGMGWSTRSTGTMGSARMNILFFSNDLCPVKHHKAGRGWSGDKI